MKYYLTLAILTISVIVEAQNIKTITGTVQDAQTGEPLPFSSVFIKGKSIGTIANENGAFSLNISDMLGSDSLTISHIGYTNFYGTVNDLPVALSVRLNEAVVNLSEISVEATKLSAEEIFNLALEKIKNEEGYLKDQFRLDGFYREIHTSGSDRTGVLECAVEIYDNSLTQNFKEIVIPHFRKVYDRQQNVDQFIQTKEGHNHLLLLLNNGINLIPLAAKYKSTVWKLPLTIEKITYFNDRLVYVLSNMSSKNRELRVLIDLEDYSVYKNELILKTKEEDHERYAWRKVTTNGEKCGAIRDHQAYEYRKVNGKLIPYYFFRKFDFRCYDLTKNKISTKAAFSTELLINNADTENIPKVSPDKLKRKKGLINRTEPYDSVFWKYYNDLNDISIDQQLVDESRVQTKPPTAALAKAYASKPVTEERPLKIGNHDTYQFNRADTLFGSLSPLLSCYDVGYYHLDVDVDPEKERIEGVSKISFKMVTPSDKIRIDLLEYLSIERISFEDSDLDYTRDLDAVYVNFGKTLKKDSVYSIKVEYQGRPLDIDFDIWAGGFMWDQDEKGQPFIQSICQGYGPKGWWPSKNHVSDEPDSAAISVTVPKNLFAVSNGVLQSTETLENDKNKFNWKVVNPINNYNLAIHIGNYEQQRENYTSQNGAELSLDYFFLSEDEALAKQKLLIVPKMLEVYEKYLGAYPFIEDGFKIVQSLYPMEHQSCVAVGQYFDDQLILHEAAHEWWGNSVSCRDNADIWIHEAFATYAESLYIEETLGYDLGQEYLNAKKGEIHNDHPIVGIEGVNHFHYRIEDKYFKGALMLNTLRHLVDNDPIWFEALLSIQQEFRHAFVDTRTILDHLNDKLGADYTDFFHQYLRTVKIPILIIQQMGNQTFKYRWENTEESFGMSMKWDELMIEPSLEWQKTSLKIASPEEIKRLQGKYLIKVDLR
ncbi:MAG: carboxypeptidase-like regulatory domain-containing protein [Cyclobacteriaceae bacterium]